jgi:hypothetical protein
MPPVWITLKICECLSALGPCVFKVRFWCNSAEVSTLGCIQSSVICAAIPSIVIAGYYCFGRVFCLHFQNNPGDKYHNDNILYTSASYFKLYKSLFLNILKYSVSSVDWPNYRGADKSFARPGRKQATATEDFDFHTSYL